MKSPFPWFGGKSRVASDVWNRFGDVANYVEPFFGSGAVLLNRPSAAGIETINDKDRFVANFWRALQAEPETVAKWCDWPVNEADLHARHLWLVTDGKAILERVQTEPEFFDAKIAGWWCWGLCQWIGSGWCLGKSSYGQPFADGRLAHERLPHLGTAGRGVHRPSQRLPHLGTAGMGVHRPSLQLPHLGNAGMGDVYEYMHALADRLRRVRVCCGDWSRVCGPTPTDGLGLCGVFLDPPYPTEADRDMTLYAEECGSVAHEAAAWAIKAGERKTMRIAFCGYEGSHTFPDSWECLAWKAAGGYASQRAAQDEVNSARERIWFSPHCLKVDRMKYRDLFVEVDE